MGEKKNVSPSLSACDTALSLFWDCDTDFRWLAAGASSPRDAYTSNSKDNELNCNISINV